MKKVGSFILSLIMIISSVVCVDLSAYAETNSNDAQNIENLYSLFSAGFYRENFNKETPSFARTYYNELSSDAGFMADVYFWEGLHIATSPSYAMESGMITMKEYYKTVLFDLFAQSDSSDGLDKLLKFATNKEASYIVSITKTITKAQNVSAETLKKLTPEQGVNALLGTKYCEVFGAASVLTKIAGWTKDAKELVEAFAKYQAIADMKYGTKELLQIIADDTKNPIELREAAEDCVTYFGEGYEKVLNQILAGSWDIAVGVFNTVADVALDWAWGLIIGSITTATGGAIGSAILLGAKGVRVLSNYLFSKDKEIESFYKLKAAVILEDAIKNALNYIENNYETTSNFSDSNLFLSVINTFEESIYLGLDYSVDFLCVCANSNFNKSTDFIFGLYNKYMNLVDEVSKFKNNKVSYFLNFEIKCQNFYKSKYYPDFDSVINGVQYQNIPIESIQLTNKEDISIGSLYIIDDYVQIDFLPESHTEILNLCWTSSNENIIKFLSNCNGTSVGIFDAVSEGTCTITCTQYNTDISQSITVNVVGDDNNEHDYYSDWECIVNYDDKTATITGYNGTNEVAVIPSYIDEFKVAAIKGEQAAATYNIAKGYGIFYKNKYTKRVVIPSTVEKIDKWSFSGCHVLETVLLNEGVLEIAQQAFSGCDGLTELAIPKSCTSVGYAAFEGCSNLTSVFIPKNLNKSGGYVFQGSNRLTEIKFEAGTTHILPGMFRDCKGLKNIEIPDSIIEIGNSAFLGCASLCEIRWSNNLKTIGDDTFYNCSNLTSITLPDSVKSIGDSCFERCTSLKSICIPDGVGCIGNHAFSYSAIESINIPDSVYKIGGGCFYYCQNLKNAVIGSGVTSLPYCSCRPVDGSGPLWAYEGTFEQCISLETLELKGKNINIKHKAFLGCKNLKRLDLNVSAIGALAFYKCDNLKTISIDSNKQLHFRDSYPEKMGSRYGHTFEGSSVETLYLPHSFFSIDEGTFSQYARSLKDIYYNGSEATWNKINHDTIPETVTMHFCEHNEKSVLRTVKSTCTEDGYTLYKCSFCGEEIHQDIIPKTGHNYITQVIEPTCTTAGYTMYSCDNCGDSYTDSYIEPSHKYVNGICSICGYHITISCDDTIDVDIANAGDIIYVFFTPEVDGSCIFYSSGNYDTYVTLYDENMNRLSSDDQSGNNDNFSLYYNFESGKTYIFACKMWSSSVTGSFQVTLEQHEHSYSSEIVEPTCTSSGYTWYNCSCGDSFTTDYISSLGHSFVNGICERCEFAYPELIRIQENETYNVSFDTSGKSSYYSFTPNKNTNYIIQSNNLLDYVPNCTISIYDKNLKLISSNYYSKEISYCLENLEIGKDYIIQLSTYSSFDDSGNFEFSISQHEHSYSSIVFEPTCTSSGYTDYYCECGDSYTSYTGALGHDIVDGKCSRCGLELKILLIHENENLTVEITNGGDIAYIKFVPENSGLYELYSNCSYDTYGYLYDSNMNQITSNDDSGSDFNFRISYNFEAGKTYYFGVKYYDSSYVGNIDIYLCGEHEHQWETTVIHPTCVSQGYTEYICSICDESYSSDYIEALGHNYVDDICTVCGEVKSDFEYELIDDETIKITEYTGTETDVMVPSTINGYKVKEIGYSAFNDCDTIKSITFSEGIERIYCSCSNCPNLEIINIPSTVNGFDESPFSNEVFIETVIGEGNNNEDYIIEGMSGNLKNINVSPENQYFCSIDGVLYTKDMDEILRYPSGKEAAVYEIPDTVKSFSSLAFAFCGNIEKLIIPASVETVDNQAFGLFNYVKMDGYSSILELDTDFQSFEVNENNANYCSVDGILYTKDMGTLIAYPNGKTDKSFVTDNKVNKIGKMAFTYTLVENMTLSNVWNIEDATFYQSSFLKNISLSNNCNYIGYMSFAYCSKLTNIVIPDSVTIADEYTFAYCINLKEIALPSTMRKISQVMLVYCSNLSEIYIPSSVTSIDVSAFGTCEELQTVYYAGTEEEWNEINIEEYNAPLLNATVIFNSNPEMIIENNIDADTLTAAIEKFDEFDSSDYSETSYNNLKNVVDKNEELLDTAQSQEEIDRAVTEILEAIYDLQPYLNFTVSAENGSYEVTCDGKTSSDSNYSVLFGTEITLTATPNDGYEFVGWYDVTNNLYFSKESMYTFKLTENTNLKAVFVKEQSATLTFTTHSNWVQSTVTKTIDEWSETTSIEDLLPEVPYRYGYSNGRWVYDNADVLSKLQTGESVFLIPEYDEDDTSLPTPREAVDGVPALDLYYKLDADANVGSFVMAAGIPDDCRIESVGIAFYYKKANEFDPTKFELLNNNKMLVGRFNTNEIEDIYIVNMNKFTSTYNWAARGYVTYYDADGNLKTAYSNQVNIVNREQV